MAIFKLVTWICPGCSIYYLASTFGMSPCQALKTTIIVKEWSGAFVRPMTVLDKLRKLNQDNVIVKKNSESDTGQPVQSLAIISEYVFKSLVVWKNCRGQEGGMRRWRRWRRMWGHWWSGGLHQYCSTQERPSTGPEKSTLKANSVENTNSRGDTGFLLNSWSFLSQAMVRCHFNSFYDFTSDVNIKNGGKM